MRTRRGILVGAIGGSVALALKRPAIGAPASMTAVTQLGWLRVGEYAPIIVADAMGFFIAEGITHRMVDGGPGKNPVPLVAVGQAQFGIATSGMMLATARTAPDPVDVVAVGTLYQQSPSAYIRLAAPGAPEPKPLDLEGKVIGIQSESEFLFTAFARKNGIDLSKVKIVFVKATPEPLMVGQIDYFSGWIMNQTYMIEQEAKKPDAPAALQGKTWQAMRFSQWGVATYSDVIFATGQTLRDNPALVRGYLRAVARGMQYAIDHPQETVDLVARSPGQIEDAQKLAWRFKIQTPLYTNPGSAEHGKLWMDPAVWGQMIEFLKTGNQIPRAIPTAEVMTDDFLPGPSI
jgi:NitT/TauT family transport system substrate-binding protein